jgi:hypothetical protein
MGVRPTQVCESASCGVGRFFVKVKWITIPIAVIYLSYSGHYVLAVVSLLWTYLASLIGFVPGGLTGKIQKMFMACLDMNLMKR